MSLFGCPTRRSKHLRGGRDGEWLDSGLRTDENGSRLSLNGPRTRKVCVLQTYSAQLANELSVTKGEIVHLLHHAKHWAYVVNSEGSRGYIPYAFCGDPPANIGGRRLERDSARSASLQRDPSRQQSTAAQRTASASQSHHHAQTKDSATSNSSSGTSGLEALDLADNVSLRSSMDPEMGRRMGAGVSMANVLPFFKVPYGQSAVLFDFEGEDENDLSIRRGETVTILNQDDPSWVWVRAGNRREGFVPRMYICPCGCTSIHEHIVEGLQVTMARQQDMHMLNQKSTHPSQNVGQNGQDTQGVSRHYTIAERDPGHNHENANGLNFGKEEPESVRYSVKQAARAFSESDSVPFQRTRPDGWSQAIEDRDSDRSFSGKELADNLLDFQHEHVKLIIQSDYEGRSKDELSVQRGQWVFTTDENLKKSEEMEWLYVYMSGNQHRGYIPKTCASALA